MIFANTHKVYRHHQPDSKDTQDAIKFITSQALKISIPDAVQVPGIQTVKSARDQ